MSQPSLRDLHTLSPDTPRCNVGLFSFVPPAQETFSAPLLSRPPESIIQPGAASNSTVILVELGADVERECGQVLTLCYKRSPPVPLRTLDALHLACARVAAESEIIATDKRMRDAATVLGFSLFPA